MIRMGRSSKTDTTTELPQIADNFTNPLPNNYNYVSETAASSTRAISESESMARDIKEGRLSGFVGNGTVLTGETTFQAMLRVDGHLTGRVSSDGGTLVIGGTGRVDANVLVAAAVINGIVNGDIIAQDRVELGRTARVVGNIQSPRLMIEDGAVFEGTCSMVKSKEAHDKRIAEVQAPLITNELSLEVPEKMKEFDQIEQELADEIQ
jgi:cytoskeletal protein CcmA (bactofilin family)